MAHLSLRRRGRRAARGDPRGDPGRRASRTCWPCAATRRAARPSGSRTRAGCSYSVELIRLIAERFDFSVGAACFPEVHPEAPDRESDLRYAREKVEAGAGFLDHPALLRQRALLRLRRARPRGRHRRADHPGDHADHQLRARSSDHRHVRRHDPGRARARARGARRRPGSGCRARSRLRDSPVLRSPGARRARDPLLHAEPLARNAGDPGRAARRAPLDAGARRRSRPAVAGTSRSCSRARPSASASPSSSRWRR